MPPDAPPPRRWTGAGDQTTGLEGHQHPESTSRVRQPGVDPYLQGPSPEMRASRTLGWWHRHGPAYDPAECPPMWRTALATELVHEAQRRVLIERLDSIARFLAAGATPEQALYRLCDLVDQLWTTAVDDVLDAAGIDTEEAA